MRLIRCLLAVVLFGVLVFVLYDPWIQDFLFHPYREVCAANPSFGCNGDPVLITPLGGFTTRMKVAGWGGFILALPVVLWQVWRFIVPGLESKEKRYARPFILCTIALFLFGAFVAYVTLQPRAAVADLLRRAGHRGLHPGELRQPGRADDGRLRRRVPVPRAAGLPAARRGAQLQAAARLVALRDGGHRGRRRRDHAERRPHQHAGARPPDVPLLRDLRRHRLACQPASGKATPSRPSGRPEPPAARPPARPPRPVEVRRRGGPTRHTGAVHRDRAAAARPLRLPPRPLPAPGHRRPRRRSVGAGRRADRLGQDRGGRVRRGPGPRRGPPGVLHHADQGAVEPEVPRPRGRSTAPSRSGCSPATTASTATRRSS